MTHADGETLPIKPLPGGVSRRAGAFVITPETLIVADEANQKNAGVLRYLVTPPTGFQLRVQTDFLGSTNVVHLTTGGDREALGHDGYQFDVSPDTLRIEAPDPTGNLYGIQAVRQLLPIWTQLVPNQARLDYQTDPRLTALAETGWSQKERKDLEHFGKRLGVFVQRLNALASNAREKTM